MKRILLFIMSTALASLIAAVPALASFPGQNGRIAFSSDRASQFSFAIYSMNPDGSDVTRMTPGGGDFTPNWSADGTEVVFTTIRDGFPPGGGEPSEIYRMNGDGTGQTRLTHDDLFDTTPAWSPDSHRIAFGHERPVAPGSTEINTMTRDGDQLAMLTTNPSHDDSPDWSPDGGRIAYVSFCCSTGQYEVFTMNPDGSGQTNITNHDSFDLFPSWSPDGEKIAFSSNRSAVSGYDIFVMNADGTNLVRLTTDPGTDLHPVWSPDGTRIAFATSRHDAQPADCDPCNWEIYTMAADGSDQTRITFDAATDWEPSWQPVPGPARADYKNAAQFCKAEREFWGEQEFRLRYGRAGNGYGKCVSAHSP